MSDITIDMSNNKEKFADYIASELKDAYKNEKATLVVIDTPTGVEVSPHGYPVELCTVVSMGLISVINDVSKKLKIPQKIVFKSIMQSIENNLNGMQG